MGTNLAEWGRAGRGTSALRGEEHKVVAVSRKGSAPGEAATRAMERYAAGDEAAFAALYDLVVPRLYSYLIRRTANPVCAEDLLQQTLLQVHRARASFVVGADVLPWIFAIARRLVIDAVRAANRASISTQDLALTSSHVARERADDMFEAKELAGRFAVELARLPEPQRIAFDLLKRQGLSLSEAANTLKISVGALKVRLYRAQVALRLVADDDDLPAETKRRCGAATR
jgi:RNA polymerase sigma-70 factor (ECF subfamily)